MYDFFKTNSNQINLFVPAEADVTPDQLSQALGNVMQLQDPNLNQTLQAIIKHFLRIEEAFSKLDKRITALEMKLGFNGSDINESVAKQDNVENLQNTPKLNQP